MEPDALSRQQLQKQKAETLFALVSGPLASSAEKLSARSRGIPSDKDFHFYNNFDRFRGPARKIAEKSSSLLGNIGSSGPLLGRQQQLQHCSSSLPSDLDEAYDWLVNLNDEFLERFGVSMDEFMSLRTKEEESGGKIGSMGLESGFQMVYGRNKKMKNGAPGRDLEGDERIPVASPLVVKVASRDKKTTAPHSKVPFHIPTIPRPQDEFNILVNNSNQPFEHVWLERSEDGSHFIHPLVKLSVFDFIDRNIGEVEPVKPPPIENTQFKLVEGVKELKELAAKLCDVNEFAVDLEHNQYRSFQGLTCVMQISTRMDDFVVDTLKLRVHIGPYLREVFKDPSKRKVMHGADRDILWLQRDFGIYVCNLFDTGQASRVMQLERNSLEFLLHHFCGVTANKEYQNADWRLRPIPDEMLKYAREDTHYLLYMYDLMRRKLLSESPEFENGGSLLAEVYMRSYDICMQLYEKELLTDTSYLHIYGLQEANFNSEQLAIVSGLCEWRDNVARAEDESTGYILPNKAVLEIARHMPLSSVKLRRLVKSKHPFVERYLSSVIGIISSAIENAAAFESISEQLKKGRVEAVREQKIEAVGGDSEHLPVIEHPSSRESLTSQGEIVNGGSSIRGTEYIATSIIAKDDDLESATTEHGCDKAPLVSCCLSMLSSEIGTSTHLSDRIGITNNKKMKNGSVVPLKSAKTVSSVQTLKKPTGAFGALLGSSSSKRKFDPDRKGRYIERDKTEIKLEQIKSSVTLPFHSFSGGVAALKREPEKTAIAFKSHHTGSLKDRVNEPAEATKLEDIILLTNESDDLQLSTERPMPEDSLNHREWFLPIPENVKPEGSELDMYATEEPMSLSALSSSFERCFQSRNQTPSQNNRATQEPSSHFQLQPFDYAAARKQVKFGHGQEREAGAEGDDSHRTLTDSKGRRKGSVAVAGPAHGEERMGYFQQPRRRQAFPASGNRSATFH